MPLARLSAGGLTGCGRDRLRLRRFEHLRLRSRTFRHAPSARLDAAVRSYDGSGRQALVSSLTDNAVNGQLIVLLKSSDCISSSAAEVPILSKAAVVQVVKGILDDPGVRVEASLRLNV